MHSQLMGIFSNDWHKVLALAESWGFNQESVKELCTFGNRRDYRAGATIFGQNDPAETLMWICRGVVTVHRTIEGGAPVLVRVLGRGDLLGVADRRSRSGDWIHSFSATAVTSSTVLTVSREHAYRVLRTLNPEAMIAFMERLNAQWVEWIDSCVRFLGMRFRERMDEVFYQLGAKFGVIDKAGIALRFEPSHADLAEMIGSSTSLVKKLLADMNDEGELARRGARYILLKGGTLASTLMRESGKRRLKPRPIWPKAVGG